MAYNGSGLFQINSPGQPVVSGTLIEAAKFNSLTADIATGLSTALTKDGQTTVTANIPMSTFRFTGLGAGTVATDSVNFGQVQNQAFVLLSSVAGVDTITASSSPAITSYASGQAFRFVSAGANTGAVTININTLGAKSITKMGTTALVAGDIPSGAMVEISYDGTRFQLTNLVAQRAANADVSTNIAAGGAGQIPYQSGASTTALLAAGSAGQVLTSGGAGAPTWGSKVANITGGGAGQIHYQSAADTTAMLAAGVSGQVLKSNGASAPAWVNVTSYTSTTTPLPAASSAISVAHGLGAIPKHVWIELTCITAEAAYSIGDVIVSPVQWTGANTAPLAPWKNATNVGFTLSNGYVFAGQILTSGSGFQTLTAANWSYKFGMTFY